VNLIGNAVKFTERGGVVVSLGAALSDSGELRVVDVSDTGIGIPIERQPYLFEPFSQADASIPNAYGGTGLGLALSRSLAERLGGTVTLLRSAPGHGSTFRLTLRSLGLPRRETASPDRTPPASGEDIRGTRVLLAEDHPDIQRAMRRLLEGAGASVELAADGREAVLRAKSGRYDVVLMDLRMPLVSGLDAARALRQDGCRIPIIALTADPSQTRQREALDAGCDACLCKPFTMDQLVAAIQSARAAHLDEPDVAAGAPSPAGV
jgi:CheY-like chemotaxis protein